MKHHCSGAMNLHKRLDRKSQLYLVLLHLPGFLLTANEVIARSGRCGVCFQTSVPFNADNDVVGCRRD